MRVLRVLADATNVIAEGEVMQLMNCHNPDIDENGYLAGDPLQDGEAVRGRDAARRDPRRRGARRRSRRWPSYGMHLGTAFQLIDDVLDYSGDQAVIGKNVGDDLAEGKTTLPLIYVDQARHAASRRGWCGTRSSTAGATSSAVIEAIRATGALDYARDAGPPRVPHRLRRAGRPAADKGARLFATIGRLRGNADVLADSNQRSALSQDQSAALPRVFSCCGN